MNSKERRELEEKEFIELMSNYAFGKNYHQSKLNIEPELRRHSNLYPLDLEYDYFSIESEDIVIDEEEYRLIS